MTTQAQQEKDLAAEKLEAEVKEAEATLKLLQAQAQARKARQDMDEISGLTAAKERVKKDLAAMKRQAAGDYAVTKQAVQDEIQALKAGIERASERFTAWDTAREQRFYARLDEAEARLKVWTAQADQKRAERGMQARDELATLQEKIALARARVAEARHEKHRAKSQAALEDAAQHFDEAYEAATRRYDRK